MILLVDFLDEHSEAIEYDLIRCGNRLRDFPHGAVTWRDLYVMVRHAQPDTAVYKALNPRWPQTTETEALRLIEVAIRRLEWRQTKNGHRGVGAPEPWPWPWEVEVAKPDTLDWSEAADWLGWEAEMSRFSFTQDEN